MLSSKIISLSDFFLTFSKKELVVRGRLENITGVIHQHMSSHTMKRGPMCEGHTTISHLPNLILTNRRFIEIVVRISYLS